MPCIGTIKNIQEKRGKKYAKNRKKKVLEERVAQLAELTARNYVVGYWNGLSHVYNKDNGDMLLAGSLRECKLAVDMFIMGYDVAIVDCTK